MKNQTEFEREKQLVCDTLDGNKQAFGEIFLRYQYRVREFSRAMLKAYGFPENGFEDDIAQRTFIEFERTLKNFRFEDEKSLERWLFGISRNQVRNEAKSKNITLNVGDVDYFFDENAEQEIKNIIYEENFDDDIYEEQIKRITILAIEKLKSPYQETMKALVGSNFKITIEQLTMIFDSNEETIRTRLRRGRQLLGSLIEEILKQVKCV